MFLQQRTEGQELSQSTISSSLGNGAIVGGPGPGVHLHSNTDVDKTLRESYDFEWRFMDENLLVCNQHTILQFTIYVKKDYFYHLSQKIYLLYVVQ